MPRKIIIDIDPGQDDAVAPLGPLTDVASAPVRARDIAGRIGGIVLSALVIGSPDADGDFALLTERTAL